jgi:hypothetical protein
MQDELLGDQLDLFFIEVLNGARLEYPRETGIKAHAVDPIDPAIRKGEFTCLMQVIDVLEMRNSDEIISGNVVNRLCEHAKVELLNWWRLERVFWWSDELNQLLSYFPIGLKLEISRRNSKENGLISNWEKGVPESFFGASVNVGEDRRVLEVFQRNYFGTDGANSEPSVFLKIQLLSPPKSGVFARRGTLKDGLELFSPPFISE